ncbi:MAG: hypothetical protein NMNS02_03830 [Nitrosomonas sp.]|nr:MAG: hypothetical protein NMNS02_03830 [Nitrosomonas sp.]
MLVFFVLSAFIPVLFLALLSYWESNRVLVKQVHTKLDADTDIYKRSIYDRLIMVDQLLNSATQRVAKNDLALTTEKHFESRFRSLTLVLPTGNLIPILGKTTEVGVLSVATMRHLSKGKSVLLTQANNLDNNILIIQAVDPLAPEKGVLVAEISPLYLWGDIEDYQLNIVLCILDEDYKKLFCSQSVQTDSIGRTISESTHSVKGEFIWQEKQKKYIANYQEILLEPRFFLPRWLVVAAQAEIDALGSMKTFNIIFWGSVILAVLSILFFSMIQIRRVLVPLEKLIDGTRRLGNNDFTSQVDVISPDEFGELATSFNVMTARLGNQFETLTALSEIDREILSGLNIEKIAKQVLLYLRKTVSSEFASISVFNHDCPEKTSIYILDEQSGQLQILQHEVSNELREPLVNNLKWFWISGEQAQQLIQNEKLNSAIEHFFVLPLNWQNQIVGFISLGFHESISWQETEINRIQDYADRVAVALFSKNREELLLRQARIDSLTGLPNRFLFMEQLQKEIAQTQRTERKLAIFYIDLDRFKKVNDSYGHATGDKLLCEAGERLRHCVRESDTVARLGGDEFAVIISELDSERHVITIAEQAVSTLAAPFVVDGEENIIAASIGIAIYPQDGRNIADLMRHADIAMYRSKEENGNQYLFFEESMNEEVIRRTIIERELRHAISEQQFVLHYQPQVDPKTNKVCGVEALVRWNHPQQGIISPFYFIGVAEDTGLIAEIGNIVLAEACKQFCAWINQGIELEYVAVNVSVRQFLDPNFPQTVMTVLQKNDMPAHCLELEITESIFMDDTSMVLDMLHQFQQSSIQLSIDDFGTGYSSMSYLEQLPFDTLKIDTSFVRKIQDNGEGGTIAATIIAMAHALNKKVVAEGVETQAQLDFLRKHNCELIQGYFFSRPLPAEELATYVNVTNKVLKPANLLQAV